MADDAEAVRYANGVCKGAIDGQGDAGFEAEAVCRALTKCALHQFKATASDAVWLRPVLVEQLNSIATVGTIGKTPAEKHDVQRAPSIRVDIHARSRSASQDI
ncbi:MAG: hypothetical protein R3F44_01440 [Candidatus Competibacteraceae bacterium]